MSKQAEANERKPTYAERIEARKQQAYWQGVNAIIDRCIADCGGDVYKAWEYTRHMLKQDSMQWAMTGKPMFNSRTGAMWQNAKEELNRRFIEIENAKNY